jgi:putative membrane protein
MWIFPVVGLVVFLLVIYLVFTRGLPGGCGFGGHGRWDTRSPSPLDILKTRYAKGEIGREEFERMKKDLMDDGNGR